MDSSKKQNKHFSTSETDIRIYKNIFFNFKILGRLGNAINVTSR